MTTQVKLPKVGDDIDSADILEVFVKEGDVVQQGQNIVEVETGKATVVIESTQSGKVSKIHVQAGQSVPVGGDLISVEAEAGTGVEKPAPPAEKPKGERAEKAEKTATKESKPKPTPSLDKEQP